MDWFVHVAIAVVIGFLIVTFVAQRTLVHDVSMQPTLNGGDNLIVEKISPKIGKLNRGDIIVFYDINEDRQLIKRLIAVEGDTVEIKDGKVFVNGEELKEDYIKDGYTPQGINPQFNNLVVPKGHVYVLGDNRKNSRDSRSIGPIAVERITGKAIFRFYPFNKIRVF
ncbi:MAG TPA: signal peptidase I [Clostridiaceae bacterium]|nr:signal peptidase I [Clostridiaceae bacterium]